jgi:hypothetical protein
VSEEAFNPFPPNGLDRATGIDPFPGTPTPPDVAIASQVATPSPTGTTGDGSFFEEDPDSPEFDFGEQGTAAHTFTTDPTTFYTLLQSGSLARGQYYTDSTGDISRVLTSSVKWLKADRVKLRMTMEGINWGIPPDEFTIEPLDINPDLMKHPRYNDGSGGATGNGLTDAQKGVIRAVTNSQTSYNAATALNAVLNGGWILPNNGGPVFPATGATTQQKMAWEVIQRYWRGEDTFYLPAIRVTWSRFYPIPLNYAPDFPGLNPGGYIEDPVADGIIPYFFWSLDGTDNPDPSNDILQNFAIEQIGNLYTDGVTYLRQCDQLIDQRTWYKLISIWVGAPTGETDAMGNNYIYWDPVLYSKVPPPLGALPAA